MCSLSGVYFLFRYIPLFQERLSKQCTRDNPEKVIWDMINTLFLITVAVEPTFVAFLSTGKHVYSLSYHSFKFL